MTGWQLLVAAALQVPIPMTVNDLVLGRAEDFSLQGPGRVCLNLTAFDLAPGETAYVDYLGIHYGRLRIIGRHGNLDLAEGESYAEPRMRNQILLHSAQRMIVRYGRGARRRYLLFAPTDWSEREDEPILWIHGSALNGTTRDLGMLGRIRVLREDFSRCTRRFEYGWNFLMGPPEAPRSQ
jgi:hypothetical protein